MKRSHVLIAVALIAAFVATPALAAEAADGASGWGLGLGLLGLGVAAAGGALGQGRAAADALAGMARNPGASGKIQTGLLLGLAFMESLVIFVFAMVFLKT